MAQIELNKYKAAKRNYERLLSSLKAFDAQFRLLDTAIKRNQTDTLVWKQLYTDNNEQLDISWRAYNKMVDEINAGLKIAHTGIGISYTYGLYNTAIELTRLKIDVQSEIDSRKQAVINFTTQNNALTNQINKNPQNSESLKLRQTLNSETIESLSTQIQSLEKTKLAVDSLAPLITTYTSAYNAFDLISLKYHSAINKLTRLDSLKEAIRPTFKDSIALQFKEINILKELDEKVMRRELQMDRVIIEFTDGFIENVEATGRMISDKIRYYDYNFKPRDSIFNRPDIILKFENRYPIGFSRKRDYENLKYKSLFTMEKGRLPEYTIPFEDLVKLYRQFHFNGRRDFSPADTVLNLSFDTPETNKYWHTLYKERTYRILEAKLYSDFVGLDRTAPNGLIQIELERKVPLITNRFPRKVFKYEMWNLGLLGYVAPIFVLSKIEDNNKNIVLKYRDEIEAGRYAPQQYSSTLELKRHENLSVGFDLNLALLDIPTFKSTFYLDYGFRYGRVAVIDSMRTYNFTTQTSVRTGSAKEFGVNTMQFFPRISWLIRSDERYSFIFSGSVNWYYLRANEFTQVSNETIYDNFRTNGDGKRVFSNVSMAFTLRPNDDSRGRLFFRYQFNWQWNYANTGFHQAQVGYSFYLLGHRKQD